jgi:hypothetical protein
MQWYCPACFVKVGHAAPVCASCGVVAADWEAERTYAQRLVHALGHPLPMARMSAIIALGGRGDDAAAVPLALCALAHPVDVVQAQQVLTSIDQLPAGAERSAALRMLQEHPARVVRRRAATLLQGPG